MSHHVWNVIGSHADFWSFMNLHKAFDNKKITYTRNISRNEAT